jgi:hypothetical protein
MKVAVADKLKEVSQIYPGFTYTFVVICSSIISAHGTASDLCSGSFAVFSFMFPAMFGLYFENSKACIMVMGSPYFVYQLRRVTLCPVIKNPNVPE